VPGLRCRAGCARAKGRRSIDWLRRPKRRLPWRGSGWRRRARPRARVRTTTPGEAKPPRGQSCPGSVGSTHRIRGSNRLRRRRTPPAPGSCRGAGRSRRSRRARRVRRVLRPAACGDSRRPPGSRPSRRDRRSFPPRSPACARVRGCGPGRAGRGPNNCSPPMEPVLGIRGARASGREHPSAARSGTAEGRNGRRAACRGGGRRAPAEIPPSRPAPCEDRRRAHRSASPRRPRSRPDGRDGRESTRRRPPLALRRGVP